jgi:RNA polymerase sigma-70 factor (ECF subfamily)
MPLPLFSSSSAALPVHLAQARASLFRLAFMWCHDRALADDLTQEALTKALRHAGQLRDATRMRAWLYGILANCWRDHLRARRPHDDIDAIDEELLATHAPTEQAAIRSQLAVQVRQAVACLPVGQREVLALVDLEECSYAEVAQILEIPIGTVMSRLCRARAGLRARLADADPAAQRARLRSVK